MEVSSWIPCNQPCFNGSSSVIPPERLILPVAAPYPVANSHEQLVFSEVFCNSVGTLSSIYPTDLYFHHLSSCIGTVCLQRSPPTAWLPPCLCDMKSRGFRSCWAESEFQVPSVSHQATTCRMSWRRPAVRGQASTRFTNTSQRWMSGSECAHQIGFCDVLWVLWVDSCTFKIRTLASYRYIHVFIHLLI